VNFISGPIFITALYLYFAGMFKVNNYSRTSLFFVRFLYDLFKMKKGGCLPVCSAFILAIASMCKTFPFGVAMQVILISLSLVTGYRLVLVLTGVSISGGHARNSSIS
jgi:hypothetical protein